MPLKLLESNNILQKHKDKSPLVSEESLELLQMGLLTRIIYCTGIKQANEAARNLMKCNKESCNNKTIKNANQENTQTMQVRKCSCVLGRRLGEMTSKDPFQIKSVYKLKLQIFNLLCHQKIEEMPIPYPNCHTLDSQVLTQHRSSSYSP